MMGSSTAVVDLEQQQQHPTMNDSKIPDFSFCILWSPLPLITWMIPFIGHMGIADSRGVSHDFQGPYSVAKDNSVIPCMAFGPTTRYLKMDIGNLSGGVDRWDEAISEADRIYCQRIHNIFCDNCHSHVAKALNLMPYNRNNAICWRIGGFRQQWNMISLCFLIFFRGRFVGVGGFLSQFLPFTICFFLILVFKFAL